MTRGVWTLFLMSCWRLVSGCAEVRPDVTWVSNQNANGYRELQLLDSVAEVEIVADGGLCRQREPDYECATLATSLGRLRELARQRTRIQTDTDMEFYARMMCSQSMLQAADEVGRYMLLTEKLPYELEDVRLKQAITAIHDYASALLGQRSHCDALNAVFPAWQSREVHTVSEQSHVEPPRYEPLRPDQVRGASDATQSSWESGVVRIRSGRSVGSGFFVAPDLVATNAHVVRQSKKVLVSFSAGSEHPGSVVYKDDELDFVLVRSSVQGTALPLRNTPLTDGENVVAVGFPQGRQVLAGSTGTVRKIVECCVEHDALVAGGSSGGPLLDGNSNVVGINTLLVKAKGDRKNETDRTWALKMSYILESLSQVGEAQGQ